MSFKLEELTTLVISKMIIDSRVQCAVQVEIEHKYRYHIVNDLNWRDQITHLTKETMEEVGKFYYNINYTDCK